MRGIYVPKASLNCLDWFEVVKYKSISAAQTVYLNQGVKLTDMPK